MSDFVICAEDLGKRYLIGHAAEREALYCNARSALIVEVAAELSASR